MSRVIEHHVKHHRLIQLDNAATPEQLVLALMFRKAYEHASGLADDHVREFRAGELQRRLQPICRGDGRGRPSRHL